MAVLSAHLFESFQTRDTVDEKTSDSSAKQKVCTMIDGHV